MNAPASGRSSKLDTSVYFGLAGLLFVSFLSSIYLSYGKLFWEDELFEYYSDARPTIHAVIAGQRLFPFSLEPPAFHVLLHFMQKLPMRPEISTRLPSAVALLVIQVSLFYLVRWLMGSRGMALLAALLPMVLATFDYSAEARVYSLLTATYAVSFVFYAGALRWVGWRRLVARAGLFLSLSGCVLLHYYGVFLPLPFLLAEGDRVLRRGAGSYWTLAAVVASLATFVLNVPFLGGLREIQATYYDSGEARWDMAPLTYVWVVVRGRIYHLREQGHWKAGLVSGVAVLLLIVGLLLVWRRYVRERGAEGSLLLALMAGLFIPVANLVVGIYHAHAYTPRYSLPVVVPMVVLSLFLLEGLARRRVVTDGLIAGVLVIALVGDWRQIRLTRLQTQAWRAAMRVPPEVAADLAMAGDRHVYFQDLTTFLPMYFYASDEMKGRLVGVESVPMEERWQHSATSSLFLRNMRASAGIPVRPFAELRGEAGGHLLAAPVDGSGWVVREMEAEGLPVRELGRGFESELYLVRVP